MFLVELTMLFSRVEALNFPYSFFFFFCQTGMFAPAVLLVK